MIVLLVCVQQQADMLQFCVECRIQAVAIMPFGGGRVFTDPTVILCSYESDEVTVAQVRALCQLCVCACVCVCMDVCVREIESVFCK